MALIASRLSNLVPFSGCALFLHNEDTDTLYCRFATGADAEHIQQLAIKSGLGLVGWVARNRRPLVNARPGADFEATGSNLHTSLQSATGVPAAVRRPPDWCTGRLSRERQLLSRRPSAPARSGLRAGRARCSTTRSSSSRHTKRR
jgi:hypothetical protein